MKGFQAGYGLVRLFVVLAFTTAALAISWKPAAARCETIPSPTGEPVPSVMVCEHGH